MSMIITKFNEYFVISKFMVITSLFIKVYYKLNKCIWIYSIFSEPINQFLPEEIVSIIDSDPWQTVFLNSDVCSFLHYE